MNTFLIIVLIIGAIFIVYNSWLYTRSKKSVGKKILLDDIKSEFKSKIDNQKGILYFFSKNCSNCKAQLNILENMELKENQLIKINVHEETNTTKAFNVMGTPTLVFFANNYIAGYYVGVKNEVFIAKKLKNLL